METRGYCKWPSKSPGDGGQRLLTRRTLLSSAFVPLLKAQNAETSSFDLSLLDDLTVPAELFFVHEHFPAPNASRAGWQLSISGAVKTSLKLSYEEITSQPRKILPVTLE